MIASDNSLTFSILCTIVHTCDHYAVFFIYLWLRISFLSLWNSKDEKDLFIILFYFFYQRDGILFLCFASIKLKKKKKSFWTVHARIFIFCFIYWFISGVITPLVRVGRMYIKYLRHIHTIRVLFYSKEKGCRLNRLPPVTKRQISQRASLTPLFF